MNDEMNNRSEYPAARVVVDIVELLQDMADAGFAYTLTMRSTRDGGEYQSLFVTLWPQYSENNVFVWARSQDEHAPIIGSGLKEIGSCWYSHNDFECLHKLYDAMFDLLRARKGGFNHETF